MIDSAYWGKRFLFGIALALIHATVAFAQQGHAGITLNEAFLKANRAVQSNTISPVSRNTLQRIAAPRYDVIAVRVSFQPDTSRFTTGNGTFSGPLFDSLEAKVDPLPHDQAYFEAHLAFLEHYIQEVSDQTTTVTTHLIEEEITVSGQMGDYSPTGLESNSDEEVGKLARLVEEVWTLADQEASLDVSAFDPATTAFVIFHAGVGRDIELVGTTLDKTPEDLPTIFFSEESLRRLVDQPISFKGISVNQTILLPRTESRQGFDFIQDEPFLVEFSINGLLAASFLNYLGVPDLFNTESGQSAIGPFGLMDPLGLFAYNGLFPPEPSAWTKQFLGWATPVVVEGNDPVVTTLHAAATSDAPQVARVPISSAEYFLVENRHRDIQGDGLVLSVYQDGAISEQRYENGQEDFNSLNIGGFEGGVVVAVDTYDWALPGGIDEDDNPLLGGMLVWHIDERVLIRELEANRVNTDPEWRGVDLEEADSAQDLGFPSNNPFGPQAHLGTPFDYFFEDNPVLVITTTGQEISLYQNSFGPSTIPNSNANSGGPGFVQLEDFSPPGVTMSFRYVRESSAEVELVDEYVALGDLQVPAGSYIASRTGAGNGIYFQGDTQTIFEVQGSGVFAERRLGLEGYSPITLPDDRIAVAGISETGSLHLVILDDTEREEYILADGPMAPVTGPINVLFNEANDAAYLSYQAEAMSRILELDIQAGAVDVREFVSSSSPIYSMAVLDDGSLAYSTSQGVFGAPTVSGSLRGMQWSYSVSESEEIGQLVLGRDATGVVGALPLLDSHQIVYLLPDFSVRVLDLGTFDEEYMLSAYPVLVDINDDNRLEVLATMGDQLIALSSGGAVMDDFPVTIPAQVASQPLVARTVDETGWVIVIAGQDGNVYAFDLSDRGRMLRGFPLSTGFSVTATPLLQGNALYGVASTGELRVWEAAGLGEVWWGEHQGDRFNRSFVSVLSTEPVAPSDALFIDGEVYNWPNPIRNEQTYFRLTPTTTVDVTITIIDMAGELIDRLELGPLSPNVASDVEWTTTASSGLYYARVKATDDTGRSETVLIKMAVVR